MRTLRGARWSDSSIRWHVPCLLRLAFARRARGVPAGGGSMDKDVAESVVSVGCTVGLAIWFVACGASPPSQAVTSDNSHHNVASSGATLNVLVNGLGSVHANGASLRCGSECRWTFGEGTTVRVQADADALSQFEGWQGSCVGAGNCEVTVTGDMQLAARFSRKVGPPASPSCDGILPTSLGLPVTAVVSEGRANRYTSCTV